MVRAAGSATGAFFAALATLRRGKPVHPRGVVFDGSLTVADEDIWLSSAALFASPGVHRAIVRFSRSLGLPRPFPDLLGMSLRVPDAYGEGHHQDFLMVTSIDAPLLHHALVPARDVQQRPYSSSFPYRVGGRSIVLGALPRSGAQRPDGRSELDRAIDAARAGELIFDLAACGLWGRFRRVAELSIGDPLEAPADALRFNPWNTGGGLEPVGALNQLRAFVYPRSQSAWARRGLAHEQLAAEEVVAQRLTR